MGLYVNRHCRVCTHLLRIDVNDIAIDIQVPGQQVFISQVELHFALSLYVNLHCELVSSVLTCCGLMLMTLL